MVWDDVVEVNKKMLLIFIASLYELKMQAEKWKKTVYKDTSCIWGLLQVFIRTKHFFNLYNYSYFIFRTTVSGLANKVGGRTCID